MQCQGRRASPKGLDTLFFDSGPRLHKNKPLLFLTPKRCTAAATDLCADCQQRAITTEKNVVKADGKYVVNQETLLHGRIHEPVPVWSKLYGGVWWNKKIAEGYTLSEETMQKLEQYKGLVGNTDMGKKVVGAVLEVPVGPVTKASPKLAKKVVQAPVPVPAAVPAPVAKPKRVVVKKEVPTATHIIDSVPLEVSEIIEIKVKKMEIDGRTVYLDSIKDKVYDMKFNYLGRYNKREERIESQYPDSDREYAST